MTTPLPPNNELLDRYFANDCSPAERAAVDSWVASSPEHAIRMARLRHIVTTPVPPIAMVELPEMLQRLRTAADMGRNHDAKPNNDVTRNRDRKLTLIRPEDEGKRHSSPRIVRTMAPQPRITQSRRPILSLFVGSVAALVIALIFFVHDRTLSVPATFASRTYHTPRGAQTTLMLSDGTRVHLAPASRLILAADYGTASRNVTLEGEAVFTVVSQAHRPFVVHTQRAATRVLGTTFAVRGYADDSIVHVAVREGRVVTNGIVLNAGDVGQINRTGLTQAFRHGDNTADFFNWMNGALVFHDTPLREVAAQLSRWYNVDFVVQDTVVGKLRLTTTIHTKLTVDAVMNVIEVTTGARVERRGQTVTIALGKRARAIPEVKPPSELASVTSHPNAALFSRPIL